MDGTANWTVFHRSATTTTQKVFYLNTTAAIADYSGGDSTWWGTLPGASVFTIGATSTAINNGTNDMISYHWHNVPGLQKFGKYTGNQNADGTFVELGFRPALVWLKETGNAGYWNIYDNKRNPSNLTDRILWANDDYEENDTDIIGSSGSNAIDLLSNGFKLRSNKTGTNRSGGTYIYCAWAESPTFNLFGTSSNAR